MGYSTRQEVIIALANALSQGSPDAPGSVQPITSVGQLLSDTVPDSQLYQYIRWGDEQIDAALSSIYRVPLRRINRGSYNLAADVTAGDTSILMEDTTRFIEGDVVVIRDDTNSQQLTVSTIPNENTITFTLPITDSYLAVDAKIERIKYPDPIPLVSAKLAAATIYDKHFAAQVEGNASEYGKILRKMAFDDLNQILNGVVRLDIADADDFVGRRFYNPALDDVMNTRAEPKDFFKSE